MTPCAVFDGPPGGLCDWCRHGPDDHDLFWCPACHGWSSLPDPTDRVSRAARAPTWLWRRVPCECRFDDHGLARRGGVVDRDGTPVDDDRLRAAGVLRG